MMEKRNNCEDLIANFSAKTEYESGFLINDVLLGLISEKFNLFYDFITSINISFIRRIYMNISPLELFLFFKNLQDFGSRTEFGIGSKQKFALVHKLLNLPNKDIVSIKTENLPEITLFRNYQEKDGSFVIICNCCYKSIYFEEKEFFDLLIFIENHISIDKSSSDTGCKLTVISKKSLNTEESYNKRRISDFLVLKYGFFNIFFSIMSYFYYQIIFIRKFITKFFLKVIDVDKEFIKYLLKEIETLKKN